MDTPEEIKIWQRVRGEMPPITEGLPGLAASAWTEAALCGSLARQIQGPGQKILLQLQEENRCHARCLSGIYQLVTGTPLRFAHLPPAPDKLDIALRKSYGKALKALRAYEERTSHGEYGAVFGCMAATQRTHCCKIAELMGLLGG